LSYIHIDQVRARLREAGFRFKRQAPRVEIWRKAGATTRVNLPRCDFYTITETRTILQQAGLSPLQIEEFLTSAVKENTKH
jgi:hypothetical protein